MMKQKTNSQLMHTNIAELLVQFKNETTTKKFTLNRCMVAHSIVSFYFSKNKKCCLFDS